MLSYIVIIQLITHVKHLFHLFDSTDDYTTNLFKKSNMAVTGVYTSWSGYLEWNHVTDLNVRDEAHRVPIGAHSTVSALNNTKT